MTAEELAIYIPIWFMCGILCAWLAKRSGRNHAEWFFLGVMFGPFAIAVIVFKVVVLDNPGDKERREAEGTDKRNAEPLGVEVVTEDEESS